MGTTREAHAEIARRSRSLSTGSADALAHTLTDEHLERIVADEMAAREAAWSHHDFARLQRAAESELIWRASVGVSFGWTTT